VDVKWMPYQIDPATNIEGETFDAYCRRRWGGSGWTNHLRQEGKKDGANFSNWKWWPNTLKAHQFVAYAARHGISTSQSNELLFEALYEEGENISLTETLAMLGRTRFNLDETELRAFLEDDNIAQEVKKEMERGRRTYRISGVPFFVVDGAGVDKPYGFSGAQATSTFVDVFEKVSNS
jgi:predicted DsbA family dithiol-disulfide isomerase